MGAVDINIESISSDSEVCDEECNTVIGSIRKHSRVAATISDRGDTISTLKPEKSRAVLQRQVLMAELTVTDIRDRVSTELLRQNSGGTDGKIK